MQSATDSPAAPQSPTPTAPSAPLQNLTQLDTFSSNPSPSLTPAPPPPPPPPETRFSDRQLTALSLLTAGRSVAAVARALNCSRQTVHNWRNDPAFADELRRRHADLSEASTARLHRLLFHATHTAINSLKVRDQEACFQHAFRLISVLRPWMPRLDQLAKDPIPPPAPDAIPR